MDKLSEFTYFGIVDFRTIHFKQFLFLKCLQKPSNRFARTANQLSDFGMRVGYLDHPIVVRIHLTFVQIQKQLGETLRCRKGKPMCTQLLQHARTVCG